MTSLDSAFYNSARGGLAQRLQAYDSLAQGRDQEKVVLKGQKSAMEDAMAHAQANRDQSLFGISLGSGGVFKTGLAVGKMVKDKAISRAKARFQTAIDQYRRQQGQQRPAEEPEPDVEENDVGNLGHQDPMDVTPPARAPSPVPVPENEDLTPPQTQDIGVGGDDPIPPPRPQMVDSATNIDIEDPIPNNLLQTEYLGRVGRAQQLQRMGIDPTETPESIHAEYEAKVDTGDPRLPSQDLAGGRFRQQIAQRQAQLDEDPAFRGGRAPQSVLEDPEEEEVFSRNPVSATVNRVSELNAPTDQVRNFANDLQDRLQNVAPEGEDLQANLTNRLNELNQPMQQHLGRPLPLDENPNPARIGNNLQAVNDGANDARMTQIRNSPRILSDDDVSTLKQAGINVGEDMSPEEVDSAARYILGDSAVEGISSLLSGAGGVISTVLPWLSPIADIAGIGFGIKSLVDQQKAVDEEASRETAIKQSISDLNVPIQAPKVGSAPVMDQSRMRSGGLSNF